MIILPSLPALELLSVFQSPGLGSEGAAALAAAVPDCPRLQTLYVYGCGLAEAAQAELEALRRPDGHAQGGLTVALW